MCMTRRISDAHWPAWGRSVNNPAVHILGRLRGSCGSVGVKRRGVATRIECGSPLWLAVRHFRPLYLLLALAPSGPPTAASGLRELPYSFQTGLGPEATAVRPPYKPHEGRAEALVNKGRERSRMRKIRPEYHAEQIPRRFPLSGFSTRIALPTILSSVGFETVSGAGPQLAGCRPEALTVVSRGFAVWGVHLWWEKGVQSNSDKPVWGVTCVARGLGVQRPRAVRRLTDQ
ncbi:hypothetical protein QBC47DRAFT_378444 [Echria macrotheca]|uniref:Uncharacterized protein n=1 Tax=Echria macrotheca TaxID=438768 RepID=A0AAJ0BJM5_9PEZI|nr:hypothetical protein QBC47DRAFT_378444 [Echria macrotheca]